MQKITKICESHLIALIAGFISLLQPFLLYLTSDYHFFAEKPTFFGFIPLIYVIICLVSAYIVFYSVALAYKQDKITSIKQIRIAYFVSLCLVALFSIINIAFIVTFSAGAFQYAFYFKKELPFLVAFILAYFAILFPLISYNIIRIAVCGTLIVVLAFGVGYSGLNLEVFKLEGSATVFDTGKDYSVAWASNTTSIGWLEYEYQGQKYKLVDDSEGKIKSASFLHHVNVPYEHLQNNTYTIYAQRVLSNVTYGPRVGKTLCETISFKGKPQGELEVLVLSDTHNITKSTRKKIEIGNPDILVVPGDFSDMLHEESNVSDFLLSLCYDAVGGTVPVLYAKGNHECHGELGSRLGELLGFENMYYQAVYGNYRFTILDGGGEDDGDAKERGELGNYAPYREEQLKWLGEMDTDSQKTDIVISHMSYFSPFKEVTALYYAQLERLGVECILAGHTHDNQFLKEGLRDDEHLDGTIPLLECGGIDGFLVHSLSYVTLQMGESSFSVTAKTTTSKEILYQDTLIYSND